MTHDPTLIEQVKRAITSVVFGLTQPDRGDVFGWFDDHSHEIAEAVLATLQGSAALPSADEVGQLIEDVLFPLFGAGPYEALAAKIVAMRATTPTAPDQQLPPDAQGLLDAALLAPNVTVTVVAPVQDDDAELREEIARALSIPQHHTTWDTLTWQEKDLFYMQADYALHVFASRLSPTPETGLVEALREYGTHKSGCRMRVAMGQSCICGWAEVSANVLPKP
jgi:hypothetical protein